MKIYQINDCDWWMAPTKEQAIADYRTQISDEPDYSIKDEVHELTDEELDQKKFCFHDGPSKEEWESIRQNLRAHGVEMEDEDGGTITFRQEMERRIRMREGKESQFFASTEY